MSINDSFIQKMLIIIINLLGHWRDKGINSSLNFKGIYSWPSILSFKYVFINSKLCLLLEDYLQCSHYTQERGVDLGVQSPR